MLDKLLACACCGELTKSICSKEVRITETWRRTLKAKLVWLDHIPVFLRDQYDISVILGKKYMSLAKVPLEHRGVVVDSRRTLVLRLCIECIRSLRSNTTKKPPWKAIANGFAFGHLPKEFDDLSYAEERMATISPLSFSLLAVWGRYGGVLNSHMVARLSSTGCAIEKVPWELSDTDIIVVFANATVSDEKLARKKFYRLRRRKTLQFVNYLRKHSFAYTSDNLNTEIYDKLPADGDAPHTTDANNDANAQILSNARIDSNRVSSGRNSLHPTNSLHSVVGITECPNLLPTKNISNVDPDFASLRRFVVSDAPAFAKTTTSEFYGQTFPRHFSFGYGTPNDDRPVHVSLERCFKHYLMLADRSMAEDSSMVLFMYDILSRRKLHMSLYLHINKNPRLPLQALRITTDDIKTLITNTAAYNSALRRGVNTDNLTSNNNNNENAQSAMRIIQKAASNAYGTPEERLKMRSAIASFEDIFGTAHLMVTSTPNDADSGWIAMHTQALSSNKDIFDIMNDWNSDAFPSSEDMRAATNKDPALAALQFINIMEDIIIPEHFGWDMKNGKPFERGGKYGIVDGFVSCFEAQGATTNKLHSHTIIWLRGWPKTSAETRTLGCAHDKKVHALADKISITTFPVLDLWTLDDDVTLQSPCCISGKIVEVSVPFIGKTSAAKFSPIVGKCSSCESKFTSMQLRDMYIKILLSAVGHTPSSSWKLQMKSKVRRIMASTKNFPMPNPLPHDLPISRKTTIRYACVSVIQCQSLGMDYIPTEDLLSSESDYIIEVAQLTIGLEETSEHSSTV